MMEMRAEAAVPRVRSRQASPVPRTQLGILPVNQRSYSRRGSKTGIYGDESPLMSPLPFYPRRRSVTFAGEREERPCYNPTFSASAPVSPVRSRQNSPPPSSILKNASSYPNNGADDGAGTITQAVPAAQRSRGESPVPQRRGRSASRQRLAARRREAQLHHSFYDDSFVEEFVLSAKTELEKEEEQRRLEVEMRREEEKAKKAEQRAQEATEKINALQHAKEVLQAAAKRRRASVTPSPTRGRTTTTSVAAGAAGASSKEANLLKSLEEDSDPEIQSALEQLARASLRRKRSTAKGKRSMPLVSEDALLDSESDLSEGDEDDVHYQQRKRAKLEKIVSNILSQQKKSKSKHSVVVINWSDTESGSMDDSTMMDDAQNRSGRVQSARRVKSRSAGPAHTVPSKSSARGRGGSVTTMTKRAASSRQRQVSEAPDLGADSTLFSEEDETKPILLPRRQHKRPQTTRSLSQIDAEMDDILLDEEAVQQAIRKPPRAPPRARRNAPRKQPPARTTRADTIVSRRDAYEMDEEESAQPAPQPRRRPAAPRVTNVSPDDPMAVFFDAAFPSPSKFDEMMMQAGGLAETGRGARGGRGNNARGQPNLVLPSSIGRRR